jgi:hypothetical protein
LISKENNKEITTIITTKALFDNGGVWGFALGVCTVHFDSKNVLKHNFSNFCPDEKYEFTLTFISFLKLVPDLKLDMLCPLFFFLSGEK